MSPPPPYKAHHQFSMNFSCNTLRIPKILFFGQVDGDDKLEVEQIEGSSPDLQLFAKAYIRLIRKMPKPLRQSSVAERHAWTWIKSQLEQGTKPADTLILKRARTYLTNTSPKIEMIWTHARFLPESLIQPPDQQHVYLVDYNHFGYRPESFGIANYFAEQSQVTKLSVDDWHTQYLQELQAFDPINKIAVNFCQIALCLMGIYSNQAVFQVEWLDRLLDLSDA